ncbi:hypothetical protein ACI6QG_16980 [Roseococcus sp. DSY-14]|uniref:hypothetical protein n=1 Tax=Roseococcus sp. DSY-14 TaxID=3369650 RepID=UPI00387AF0D8
MSASGEGAVLLLTHAEGGGIERFVQARLAAAGRPAWVLRPLGFGEGVVLQRPGLPDRAFHAPAPLRAALRGRLAEAEVHHLRSLPPWAKDLPLRLGVPYRVWIHDWTLLCPRGTFVTPAGSFCGEPALAACAACTAGYERMPVAAPGGVAALRGFAARLLGGAAAVHVATADAARRLRRHLPGLQPSLAAWEDAPAPQPPLPPPGRARICVAGRLTVHKGFGVLLACAQDAAARALPLDFVLAGRSLDDAALRATGRCAVTGEYAEGHGAALLRLHRGSAGFLPSIWPETWCYALSVLHEARLPLVAFDLGAQADRVRALGGTLLPPGLPAPRINDILLSRSAALSAA